MKLRQSAASPKFPCETCEVRDKTICAVLDDEELRELNKITTSVKLEKDETVFFEGDESTYLFNVTAGSIRLSKLLPDGRRQITGFLFPGDFMGLSIGGVYAYTAEALTETTLCRFERNRLSKLMDEFPKLERQLLQLSTNELAQAQDHLMVLGRKTATERVTTVLLKFGERLGEHEENGWIVNLPMTREDMADYLGLTTETVSRAFTRLRKEGVIITPNARSVCVIKSDELARRSGDY